MKKICGFAVALTSALLFSSCAGISEKNGEASNGLDASFSASVCIEYDEMNAEGIINRYGNDMWDIEFSSPDSISGVLLSFSEGKAEATYKGLSFSVPQSALPVKSMMNNLIHAADKHAKSEKLEGNEKDGNIELEGKLDSGDYVLTVNKDGIPVEFSMPNNRLSMIFKDYKLIEKENISETATDVSEISETST